MLRLETKQIDGFVAFEAREFEHRTARRLRALSDQLASASREELLAWVQLGRARAHPYGIRTPHDVALYIGAMVRLGRNFDRDPAFAWAAALLRDELMHPTRKLAVIYVRAMRAS